MKKKVVAALTALLLISAFTACEFDDDGRTDNGYSHVLYADTSTDSSNTSGKPTVIENKSASVSEVSEEPTSEVSGLDVSSEENSSVKSNSSSSTASGRQVTNTTETTTYYVDVNSEISSDTDTELESNLESLTVSAIESEVSSSFESNLDTEFDSDSSETSDTDVIFYENGEFTSDDLSFTIGSKKVKLNDDIMVIIDEIGEPLHITENYSSEYPEISNKTYSYEDFTVNTYPSEDGSVDLVESIEIFSDTLSTEKGVTVGMSIGNALKIYGSDFMEYGDEYRYYIDNEYMYFYVQNGLIANIGYNVDKDLS